MCAAYDVALAILRPFLSSSAKDGYNWLFVLGITACAIWLVVILYRHAEALVDLIQLPRRPALTPLSTCRFCNTELAPAARFCTGCGKPTADELLTSAARSA